MATIQSNINQLLALTAAGAYGARRLQQESYAAEDLAEQQTIKGATAAQRGRADIDVAEVETDPTRSAFEKEFEVESIEAGQGAVREEAGRIAQERANLAAARPRSIIGAARARKEAGALSGAEVEERLETARGEAEDYYSEKRGVIAEAEAKAAAAEARRNTAIRVKAEQEAARQDFFNLVKGGKAIVEASGEPYVSPATEEKTGLTRDQLLEMYRKSIKGGN